MKQSKRLFFNKRLAGIALFATLFNTSVMTPLTVLPCLAAGEVYPVDVPKKYPVSYVAYKKILPKNLAQVLT